MQESPALGLPTIINTTTKDGAEAPAAETAPLVAGFAPNPVAASHTPKSECVDVVGGIYENEPSPGSSKDSNDTTLEVDFKSPVKYFSQDILTASTSNYRIADAFEQGAILENF